LSAFIDARRICPRPSSVFQLLLATFVAVWYFKARLRFVFILMPVFNLPAWVLPPTSIFFACRHRWGKA